MLDTVSSLIMIAAISIATFATRAASFLVFLLVIKQINVSKLILSVKPHSPDTYCCLFLFRNTFRHPS